MERLSEEISKRFSKAIILAFPELKPEESAAEIALTSSEAFGHLQCNSALRLSKLLKRSPRSVAEALIDRLGDRDLYAKIDIAGPGFINITLSDTFLSTHLLRMLREPRLGIANPIKKERILVDFSAPNVAKEMHVGHLRSTIIGDAIARLFEFLGHDVLRVNHVGDWGTAFGMLIAYVQETQPEFFQNKLEEGARKWDLSDLMSWYRASKKRFDEDADFKRRALLAVVLLQGGKDPEINNAWTRIVEISKKAFSEIYALLDVKITDRGESTYNSMLSNVVSDLDKKGLLQISDGAKCVFIEGYDIPLMVQKSDGGYNYDTTDLAAMKYRVETQRAGRIIIVTDAGQSLHFKLVHAAAVKAGYIDPKQVRFDHVPFGVVLGPDGKRFRTRSGETERLIDLITAAIGEAKRLLEERDQLLPEMDKDKLAEILGIDAIKYADLSTNRIKDYLFSYERMLRFEGNTSTFLLYSYVRVNGIKRKIGVKDIESLIKEDTITITHPSERELAFHLLRFPETLHAVAEDLYPHYLTDYLFNLSQKFNAFFRDCRVEGSPEESSRLLICELTARTLRAGLEILGLRVVERM